MSRAFSVVVVGLGWMSTAAAAAEEPPASAPSTAAKNAVEPAAPLVSAEVVAALQEGRYEPAVRALAALSQEAKSTDDKAYFALLQAIAQRLEGQREAARQTLRKTMEALPRSLWAPKIRYELAGIELAAGNSAAAEELVRAEATRLLSGGRKDQLAEVYHAFARKLMEPGDPLVHPDPNAAYDLLAQARELAESPALRALLLFSMGKASMAVPNPARAMDNFQLYLRDHPQGTDRFAARLQLGLAQLITGQPLPARLTWTDLARDIERTKPAEVSKDLAFYRAEALRQIPATYGIPAPPDDTRLNQGVAALARFLAAFPAHPQAVRAAYLIGESYLSRGKSTEALAALTTFLKQDRFQIETDQARRDWAELSMTASFKVGQILQGQQKFAEAIAAWKGYLARFPNGPQSADSQRSILDTQLLAALDQSNRHHFPEARTAWSDFVAQNPLDGRVPGILFMIGGSYVTEKKFDQAIAAWEPLESRFPASEPAAHAQFWTAELYETEKGDPAAAIERFKKIAVEPWRSQAMQRIAVMEAKSLVVITPRAFRSGEAAHLKITTRNIETLSFAAYKLSAEAYFRKKNGLEKVESLDIGLVAPEASWTTPVPGYARYKPVESTYELKKLELPGVYVVKVTDEKTLQATTLVLGSDLDAIVKTSREQLLVFAQDMKTGRGRPGARVLVAEAGQIVLEATTGIDGVLLRDWNPPRAGNGRLNYLVLDGPHVAGSGLGVPDKVAQGLTPRAYIYTDRPAYRPGHQVGIRGVVREVASGQYHSAPRAVYRFEVADSRGRLIVAHPVTLSDFGTFHESLVLDSAAPVGTYRARVYQPGKSDFAGTFEVQSYQLEPIDLAFDLKKTVFYRGETIEAELVARYQYGAPLAGRPLDLQLPDGRIVHATTDAAGKYKVEFPTEGFAEEQALQLVARLPQDNVAAAATVMLAVRGFQISLKTSRDVYLDGESFQLDVDTSDAQGKPTGESLVASLVKQVVAESGITEREIERKPLATDAKTGHGSLAFRADDTQGGRYLVRVAGTDRFGNPIVADHPLTISGKKDETKLRLLADRQRYKVGEEGSVNLHSRDRAGTALLTWEADRILSYKLVSLQAGNNPVAWAIDGAQFPNFTLTAARMAGNEFDKANLDIQVERDLRVTVAVARPAVGPGEPVELDVTTADQLGRPVAAELSIAVVDSSLLRLFNDNLPAIGPYFFGQTRTGAFVSEATNTFRYEPATTAVAQAVVDEQERKVAELANAADRAQVLGEAGRDAVANLQLGAPVSTLARRPPAPAAAAPGAVEGLAMRSEAAPARRAFGKNVNGQLAGRLMDEADKKSGASWFKSSAAGFHPAGANVAFADGSVKFLKDSVRTWGYFDADFADVKAGETSTRERFVETAYWNPLVVTGKDGKARVTFKAPSALSEYRITARGITGADTLAGQTTATVTVRKSFFVYLKVPSSLTQGDKPRFVAQVHHSGVVGRLALRLAIYAGGRDEVYPRTIELVKDGIDEVMFEPVEVPEGDSMRLTLTGTVGAASDQLVVEVPVHPWGVEVAASESGTSSESTTVFVGLPPGRGYENAEMRLFLSPSLERMLIELAVGDDAFPHLRGANAHASRLIWLPPNTTLDRASELLAASSALQYLRSARATTAPEAQRLTRRVQGLVAALVAAQNPDGGWPWTRGPAGPRLGQAQPAQPASDRLASAAVVWALASVEPLGLVSDVKVLDSAVAYLSQEFAKSSGSDYETRAALLHAMSTRHAASFEAANSLNRVRNELSDPALAYLALTFANLDRVSLAGELISILGPRAKTEPTAPGRPSRVYWDNARHCQLVRGPAATTALVSLAYARVRPQAPELDGAVAWLLAHRAGTGWHPHSAKGPALAALSAYYGRAQGAEDRYQLTVRVNDTQVADLAVTGSVDGQAIVVPTKAIKIGQPNRIRFDMVGRGRYGYAITLSGFTRDFGPDQAPANRVATVDRRVYLPAAPELDGKVLPVGFGVAVNPTPFQNVASQVALGGKAHVAITAHRNIPPSTPEWQRDFLIVQEHVPAGTTLIEGSVNTTATSYELADGVLTFYFAPNQYPGVISYDVYGYLPGQYRALPTSIKSAYEPGRFHLGPFTELKVTAPGEPNTDPYKPTPDELFARGKAHFDAGRFEQAALALEPLFAGYTLRDDIAKDAARMLLLANIHASEPRKIVTYFEVVKEKAPELILTFDQLLAIGKAYREINEYERAAIVWRGLIEASYVEDARVGELLRQRGKTLEAIAYLIELWRSYPNTASIESDFFGLSQVVAQTAAGAFANPALRRELAVAGITRSQLLLQTIRMIQVFIAGSPKNPLADEASLALVAAFTELEDFKAVDRLAARFAKLYPRSTYFDSFQYSEALANFHLSRYDRAIEVAKAIAAATYKDAAGAEVPSPNKWQAIYILGQIHDAHRQPAQALEYYRQVADRFTDAAGAILAYTRKDLKVPEVSVVRPENRPLVASVPVEQPRGRGFRVIDVIAGAAGPPPVLAKPGVSLDYRNIAQVDVKVYPVDLMQLYLTRRNLNGISGIDLAGITPLVEKTVTLGSGADYDEKSKAIELPLAKEGAYLTMIRGENLYTSGIVLVTPLEIEVLEGDPAPTAAPGATVHNGRVRITVRDARTKEFLPKVQVKVIGSDNPQFISGETDLRGVFVAEGVRGLVTIVSRKGDSQYAFYRGTTYVGPPPAPTEGKQEIPVPARAGEDASKANQSLDANLKQQNAENTTRQIQRLERRYNPPPESLKGAPAGAFH
jgi:prepilin-type processing-associated H-X9-DG protein